MIPFSISDPLLNKKFEEYLRAHCDVGEIDLKTVARRCKLNQKTFELYLKQGKFFESLDLLIKVCKAAELHLLLYLGTKLANTPAYSVTYSPAWSGKFLIEMGESLRRARKSKQLSVSQLQASVHLPKGAITKMEKGGKEIYNLQSLHKIGKVLKVKFLIFLRINAD